MNQFSKPLIMGRVEVVDGVPRVVPFGKAEAALDHQQKLAALIAAAYVYRDTHSFESIERLKRCAEVL